MKIFSLILGVLIVAVSGVANAQWATPDEKSPICVASISELSRRADLLYWGQQLQDQQGQAGLAAFMGTWKFSSIFGGATVSFRVVGEQLFVQRENNPPTQVSLCLNPQDPSWLRVSVHQPHCPENKNIYVSTAGVGKMRVRAYQTRAIGSATFKKVSPAPQPYGPYQPQPCKM